MNLFLKKPLFSKALAQGEKEQMTLVGKRRRKEESRITGNRERSPNRRRKTGSIAIIRCSYRKKKKKKNLVLYWTWIRRGRKLDAFPEQEDFGTLRLERKKHVKLLLKMCHDFQRTKLFTQYQTGGEKLQ